MGNGEVTDQFTLRVEFSGLCLYLINEPGKSKGDVEDPRKPNAGHAQQFVVVMPDARKKADPILEDGTRAEAHVGYVRFDLANLDCDLGVKAGDVEDDVGRPRNEIVHRFDGEFLDLGIGKEPEVVNYDLGVPSFNKFANLLRPITDFFDETETAKQAEATPRRILMRTALSGGDICAAGSGKIWGFSTVLESQPARPYANQFGGYAAWNRQVTGSELTVTIRKFDGTPVATIPLRPVEVTDADGRVQNMITIKVSNLCAHNPLEWRDDYHTRTVPNEDADFKWLYRLLTPTAGTYQDLLHGCQLPYPKEIRVQTFGDEDCYGGSYTMTK